MNPPDSLLVEGAMDTLMELASNTPVEGCFVEVGVYKGGSAWYLAQLAATRGVPLHLFDTFTGIPERSPIDSHNVGDFADTNLTVVQAHLADVLGDIVFHVGTFPETLPPDEPRCISFVHADADQYETTKQIIWRLRPRMLSGGIILFDDYGCLDGATKAVHEMLGTDNICLTRQGKAFWIKP
jgi:O-methyltransferase